MAAIRHSRQRDAIKAYLMSTVAHPTAEIVYEHLRKEFPNISLGTIYRNLNFLVEHGEALRLDCVYGFDHFYGNVSPHNHFFCRGCGQIFDLQMQEIDHINILANADFNGKIEEHIIYFRGLCENCLKKE